MKWLVLMILFFALASCGSPFDSTYIKENKWSHESGFKVGETDSISFDNKLFDLRGDTIYYNNNPGAIVIHLDKKNYLLGVKSLDGKQKGHYKNTKAMSN